jgi:transposase
MKVELTDAQWDRISRLIPKPKAKPKGGRPRADDRAVMEGILWVLRSGARWRDMPDRYPAYATCWRRLGEWERADLWLSLWRAFLKDLDDAQQLDWSEAFMDGTFAPAKKGALASEKHARVRGQSLWYWSTARVFLSECTFRLPIEPSRSSRKKRSPK